MKITHANMHDIKLKPGRILSEVWMEVGRGDGAMGTKIQVLVGSNFDPAQSTFADIHQSLAVKLHEVLQAAASTSQADLARLLDASLQPASD